jgi:hypothetical protein
MPPLARRFVKSALAFLVFGILIGLHVAAAQYLGAGTLRHGYVVAHTHILLVGFLLSLIMGVALWMFPRVSGAGRDERDRRMDLVWWLIFLGVVARSAGEIAREYSLAPAWGRLAFGASCAEALGIVLFCISIWPRIRSPREGLAKVAR